MYYRCGIYLCLICLCLICDAEVSTDGRKISIWNGWNSVAVIREREKLLKAGKLSNDTDNAVIPVCRVSRYQAKTKSEFNSSEPEKSDAVITARFRRDDKTVTRDESSGKDYMSIYYAQRKAIMDKYKSQQKEIMERLKKTKELIAESKKLKESKTIDSRERSNATLDQISDPLYSYITTHDRHNATSLANSTISSLDFNQTLNASTTEEPIISSTILTTTEDSVSNSSESFVRSSEHEAAENSTEIRIPETTPSPVYETLRPFVVDETENVDRPNSETLEGTWLSESVNLIPENEVDFNSTDGSSVVRNERDNDTVLIDLGGHLIDPSTRNDSALDQLEKMFLWEVPASDQTIPRSDTPNKTNNSLNSTLTGASDSLRFMVEIKSSPEVNVHKNVKNLQTSTTTYRNSTHEVVEVNGVVNSTKIRVSPDLEGHDFEKTNSTIRGGDTAVTAVPGGGAEESEWCEECPHDYRWGDCEGTLFYQHNIFLRNRGPSAIDAIFGMTVQGPVHITCVEAIRFNKSRGIVSLHSGGAAHDFAKLRIRGFQGEGFSYIMKVWGVSNDQESIDSSG